MINYVEMKGFFRLFFGKLFDKKECSVCGGEIGLLGNRKLEDGNLCKECAAKLSPWFSDRRQSTVAEIQEQLAYREANQAKVSSFRTTRTLGERTKVLLDEDAGLFMVTSARNWEEANPDVLSFSDVTGCKLDIDERRTEIEYRDKEGERQSFSPRRYACSYDFYIVIHVNNPYFDEIRFRLNSSSVDNDAETLLDRPDRLLAPRGGLRPKGLPGRENIPVSNAEEVRSSMEYQKYEAMGQEIREALLHRQPLSESPAVPAAAPGATVTCPYCGATTTPDANGCYEYCGNSVRG